MQELMLQTADWVGIVGVMLALSAYFLLQTGRLLVNSVRYSLFNLLGSSLILYSLLFHWNTPAVIMEGIWFLISLGGVIRALHRSFRLPVPHMPSAEPSN